MTRPRGGIELWGFPVQEEARLLQTEQWMDVHVLYKQLGSIRAVVRHTGYSRNTVRKMLRSAGPPAFEKPAARKTHDYQ